MHTRVYFSNEHDILFLFLSNKLITTVPLRMTLKKREEKGQCRYFTCHKFNSQKVREKPCQKISVKKLSYGRHVYPFLNSTRKKLPDEYDPMLSQSLLSEL